ncbi:nuclease-related domain-containing protein [Radiobacillus deserti]|uniref:NERD domain-containing protein n=1 Tax=Radiobacillus deserti TaxID=2594883 RepID=A0A516KEM8_9BACI|nr:nuclease-related domain-containing protein [Radiobacillus deserti]QDP39858.1 NERD domain-containing protein [Radiobacillus deserti]
MNFLKFLKKDEKKPEYKPTKKKSEQTEEVAVRKGEIGEHKIDIQLSQLPKEYKYINDLLIPNPKSKSGYSQVDHVIVSPFGIFVIETKNYQGTIYGSRERKNWLLNGKFKMINPIIQNYGHIKALEAFIDKSYHDHMYSMISFTKRCTLKIDMSLREITAKEMVIYDLYFLETVNRKAAILKLEYKEPIISNSNIQHIFEHLQKVNIIDPKVREKHKDILSGNVKQHDSTELCVICKKPVSEKVKSYCLSNKKFNGKVYCYDHQKSSS